jgi:hypothetical protein
MFIEASCHAEALQRLAAKLIGQRDGYVLSRSSILKLEHFPLGHPTEVGTTLPTHIHGAPNFRRVEGDICGVAQPSVSGLISIYKILQESEESTPSWLCIRDEPVVYLDGLPFVLREAGEPLQNMRAFSGISAERVESLEARLVEDIKSEIQNNNGLVVIHEENGIKVGYSRKGEC